MCGKGIQPVFVGFLKNSALYWVVLDDVHPHGKFSAAELHQFGGIFEAVVEALEGDVLVGDAVFRFLIEIFQCFHERGEIVRLADGHDFVALRVVGGAEAAGELTLLFLHDGDKRREDFGSDFQGIFGRAAFLNSHKTYFKSLPSIIVIETV